MVAEKTPGEVRHRGALFVSQGLKTFAILPAALRRSMAERRAKLGGRDV